MKKFKLTVFLFLTANFVHAQNDTVSIRTFIEGFYLGSGMMRATVDPVNYPTLCDTLTVRLLDTVSNYNILFSSTSTISTSGYGEFIFPNAPLSRSYYIQLSHRNALTVFSKYPVYFDSTYKTYDFTAVPLGLCHSAAISSDGFALMHSGDINQDGYINSIDSAILDSAVSAFTFGYSRTDLNGNNATDASDINLLELNTVLNLWAGYPTSCLPIATDDVNLPLYAAAVYPNPTKGTFSVRLEDAQDKITGMQVKDVLGNVIAKANHRPDKIDLSGCSRGVYLVFIQTQKNKMITMKLMKE